jgi:hypothetical protein
MKHRSLRELGGSVLLLALSTFGLAPAHGSDNAGLVVHEWGTFTSIAGENGQAVEWLPLNGPSDLPCFVAHLDLNNFKGGLAGTVRMETPVLYFYAPQAMRVDVTVRFNRGVVTEWFPPAAVTPSTASAVAAAKFSSPGSSSTATWTGVSVLPLTKPSFPDDLRGGHYYLARRTEAAPLRLGSVSERFLFYRGVGGFEPPVSAKVNEDGSLAVRSLDNTPIGDVMLFENRGGHISYHALNSSSNQATLDPLRLDGEWATPEAELEKVLIAHGLYPSEAKAMVDTWRDSWFEEGSRLFYIVSRRAVDEILPVDVSPPPSALVRVFVGRMELLTMATRLEVHAALTSNDQRTLAKYARFLPAIVASLPYPTTADDRMRRASAIEQAAGLTSTSQVSTCR